MERKIVKNLLLWQSIVWVQYSYIQLPDSQKGIRPQRPYRSADEQLITTLIYQVYAQYAGAKYDHGQGADFDSCKAAVLTREMKKHDWTMQTRNFYSSVIATYIRWETKGVPQKAAVLLPTIVPLVEYVLQKTPVKESPHVAL